MGTEGYMAPESRAGLAVAGKPADLYALGVMLFEMLVGRWPHGNEAPGKSVSGLDPRLDALVSSLLDYEPAKRPSAPQAVRTLQVLSGRGVTVDLLVETDPPGAVIQVDGHARGQSPVLVSGLTTGEHRVTTRLRYYRGREQAVVLEAGPARTLRLVLEPVVCDRCGAAFAEEARLEAHRGQCEG
ncbi:MAG: PEGA domain-containing protein [Candidatus Riflebacteria bacterium]|nr:PEGA domain-containing protein [Candidatus Riflebacteria bacterium]